MTKQVKKAPRSGGRPSRKEAGRIADKILDAAAHHFFRDGYGATSIEAIVRRARISKRTFYVRYPDKADLFRAVVHRVIERLRPKPTQQHNLFEGKSLEDILNGLARLVLHAALTPEALALHRTVLAEAERFPELALIMHEQGARKEAVKLIAALLEKDKKPHNTSATFAAEQFLQMVTSAPQRRALGLGQPMTEKELDQWAQQTVVLFLKGWGG